MTYEEILRGRIQGLKSSLVLYGLMGLTALILHAF